MGDISWTKKGCRKDGVSSAGAADPPGGFAPQTPQDIFRQLDATRVSH